MNGNVNFNNINPFNNPYKVNRDGSWPFPADNTLEDKEG